MAPARSRKQRPAPVPRETGGALDFGALLPSAAAAGGAASICEVLLCWLEQGC